MRWLSSYTILARVIAAIWIVLTLLYNHNDSFHHAICCVSRIFFRTRLQEGKAEKE